jgi:two-component system sensor kinase FixL
MMNRVDTESETRELMILKHAIENTNEAFVTIDEDHTVLFFNKTAERMFGYSRDEVIGHDLNVIMSPACSRNHREAVANYMRTKIPRRIGHETEMVAGRKNGDTFPASISFSVTEVEGRLYFTGIVRDLTETKELEEQIVQSERLAALGQMVAEITHEIRNPLMMIGGFTQQLARVTEDEKKLEKLDIISEEVKRLERLLSDLREFYITKAMASDPVNLAELLKEVFSLAKGDFKRHNIQAELNLDNKAVIVAGDKGSLKQVFLNLVKNSIEAMEAGGKLLVQSKVSGDKLEIVVTDDGCGMAEGEKEKIFAPFFTTKKHGTGLGLCISKRIIERHKGSSFSVQSEEGVGTSFKISLPVYRGPAQNMVGHSGDGQPVIH